MSKAPEQITQQELESYLWGAAKLLRGLVDAGDYKQYVFPLLFFKRLSDVWEEEHHNALKKPATSRMPGRQQTIVSPSRSTLAGPTFETPRAMWAGHS